MSAVAEVSDNLPAAPVAAPAAPAAGLPALRQRLGALDRSQRMRLGAGVALLVAVVVAAILLNRQPDYRVLFANLSDKDGGAIVAQLAQMNVPYKYTEGGQEKTWTGQGRMPKAIADAVAAGKALDDFLI